MLTYTRLISLSLLIGASAAGADEAFDPATYHEATCTRCHGTEVYTRDDRRVTSFPALQAQVARCDANLGTRLFPADLGLLVDHMNDQYYKFAR
jgi:hypothetical protein